MPQPLGFTATDTSAATIPEIGIGMLGHGFMGRAHSNAYKKIPYMHWPPPLVPRLVAICGRSRERTAEAARRYGYEGYYTDWNELLADERIGLFDNVAADEMHLEPTIAALKAGKHVICEKPLALSAADAARMVRAARSSVSKSLCSFNYRFVPAVRLAHQIIQRGLLGQIYEFRGTYLQSGMANPEAPLRRVPPPGSPGAGSLSNIGSHVIDQARFLVGEVATVSGSLRTWTTERSTPAGERVRILSDDAFAAVIELANGAIGTIEATRVASGRQNRLAWEINGSHGSLAFDLERLNELQVFQAPGADAATPEVLGFQNVNVTESVHPFARAWWPRGHIVGWEHAHINQIHHFLECIAGDGEVGPYAATFEDGYRNVVICDAIKQSAAEGRRVSVTFDA
ncbi:MAG: Gfo/Idh/MocA family oxidoreductase [Chloroflexota bacterium]